MCVLGYLQRTEGWYRLSSSVVLHLTIILNDLHVYFSLCLGICMHQVSILLYLSLLIPLRGLLLELTGISSSNVEASKP